MVDLARSQRSADAMIRRWNGGVQGFLVRNGAKRPATMAMGEYKPSERGLFLDGTVRFFVSALNLSVPIDHEQDMIQFAGKIYRITQPPTGPRPSGMIIMYDCNAVYDSTVTQ